MVGSGHLSDAFACWLTARFFLFCAAGNPIISFLKKRAAASYFFITKNDALCFFPTAPAFIELSH